MFPDSSKTVNGLITSTSSQAVLPADVIVLHASMGLYTPVVIGSPAFDTFARLSCVDQNGVTQYLVGISISGSGSVSSQGVPLMVPQHTVCHSGSTLSSSNSRDSYFVSITYFPMASSSAFSTQTVAEASTTAISQPSYLDWMYVNLWIVFLLTIVVVGLFMSPMFRSKIPH